MVHPVDDLDKLVGCAPDVLAARACVPRVTFLTMRVLPPDFTFEQLQWDLDTIEKAEAAYQAELGREYDFTSASTEESTDQEPELVTT